VGRFLDAWNDQRLKPVRREIELQSYGTGDNDDHRNRDNENPNFLGFSQGLLYAAC
jgi:hypothetical protein